MHTTSVRAAARRTLELFEPAKLRDWYVDTYGLKASKQGNFEVAEAPGMRLLFAPSKEAPTTGTRGTTVDHIGFEIRNLPQFVAKLEAAGIKLDSPLRKAGNGTTSIAFVTDLIDRGQADGRQLKRETKVVDGKVYVNDTPMRDDFVPPEFRSQLPGEASPVEGRHFHPVEPRTLRLTLEKRW